MRRFVDLHTHSSASDGNLTPAELVAYADAQGLAAIALTDHDTTSGLGEAGRAAEAFPELRFIPGVEVSARFPNGTLHMLGYDFDADSPAMRNLIGQLVECRADRNPKIVENLQAMGIDISMADVEAVVVELRGGVGDGVISRVHIAKALCSRGAVRSLDDAFARYIGAGAPAFVEKDRTPAVEVIGAIHDAGGVAVLAHPSQLACANHAQFERVLRDLIHAGLDGLEAYHGMHTPEQIRLYRAMARRLGLAITGGSDYHGRTKPEVSLGRPRVPVAAITGELATRFL